MVDDVKHITETAESKEALDRARLARERREVEQRKRLDELRAHAAAAQAQREKRDDDRRRRQAEQRAKDDERRQQVEERKRAIWEASISRRETLLQREKERTERLERARAARSAPRPAFAFGSSTPRLLEPLDSGGFFWAARSTNPIDQMNFFESLAASTTNVMFASAPLTRRASALQLDTSDNDNKDEPDRTPAPMMWSSVARRRTDLVPTLPAPRAPETRSGETTPGSRPGSAMSNAGVVRRPTSAPRKPRPASIAGTGVNTPRGVGEMGGVSAASTPAISRDSSMVASDVPRRVPPPRRARPLSLHAASTPVPPIAPGEGKPPLHRKPKLSKDHDKKTPRGKSRSPSRTLSPSPPVSKEPSQEKQIVSKPNVSSDKSQVSATEVTQKLEALQIHNGDDAPAQLVDIKVNENKENIDGNQATKPEIIEVKPEVKLVEVQKPIEKVEEKKEIEEKREEKKEPSQEKTEEIPNEMTASMTARRITTEEEAKAALAERRRRAREELERQAEKERQRLQREAEEEEERQRQEEERQRREEQEAKELAALQRRLQQEKLDKAIEAQQQLEREEAERKVREEAERQLRLREEEEKRRANEEAERTRKEELEREERERLARKQRVEAIMARTRLRKAEEEKKQQEKAQQQATAAPAPTAPVAPLAPLENAPAALDNGNAVATDDLLGFDASQTEVPKPQHESAQQEDVVVETSAPSAASEATEVTEVTMAPSEPTNNGNLTADLLGLSEQNNTEDKPQEQSPKQMDNAPTQILETNNGNVHLSANIGHVQSNVGHISANFIQTERMAETQTKDVAKLLDDDFTTHNGHGNHPLTLQNAI